MKKLIAILKIAGLVILSLVVIVTVAVFALAPRGEAKMSFPQTLGPNVVASTDPAVIERGRVLVRTVAHCSQCHGSPDREHPEKNTADVALTGGLKFAMGPIGAFYAANLTPDPETGIGNRSDAQLARTIATGVLPDGRISIFMRYSAANLSEQDLVAIISYLRSIPPLKNAVPQGGLTTVGKAAFIMFDMQPDLSKLPEHAQASTEPSIQRGAYLAENVALCTACHTAYDPMTFQPVGAKGAGGGVEPSHGKDSDKEFAAPNLTPDHKTGVTGKMTEDQFVQRLKAGRAYGSSIMPWENFSRMDEGDMRSIYRFLRTLPPVENDPGPSYRDAGWEPPR